MSNQSVAVNSLIDRSKHFYELSVGNIRKKTNFIKLGREVKHEQTKIQLNFTCLKWYISELALADHVLFMQSSSYKKNNEFNYICIKSFTSLERVIFCIV